MALGDIDWTLKPKKLSLFLAKPSRDIVAKLSEAYDVVNVPKLGGINDLTFVIPIEIDKHHILIPNPNVELLRDKYLIKVKSGNRESWYVINEINKLMSDKGDAVSVKASLLSFQLADKNIRAYDVVSKKLSEVVVDALKETNWSLGYYDMEFSQTYRSFNVSVKTVLDFLFEIAETFNAVIVWDTVNRLVEFRKPESIGIDRGFKIKYGKYLRTLNKQSNSDEMVTRLKPFGNEGLSINEVNPTGSNYIEDYSFFMYPFQRDPITKVVTQSSYYMSDELCGAILDYNALVESKTGQFKSLSDEKKGYESTKTQKETELFNLETTLKKSQNTIDVQNASKELVNFTFLYEGMTISKTATLVSDRKYAVIFHSPDVANLTVKIDGVARAIQSNKWMMIAKIENVTTSVIEFSGTATSVDVDMVYVKLETPEEFTTQNNEVAILEKYSVGYNTELVDAKKAEIVSVNTQISEVDTQIIALKSELAVENNFTPEEIIELNDYIIERDWTDTNYIEAKDLYDEGVKQFEELKQPKMVIQMDIINFLEVVEAQRDWDMLQLGDTITIEYEKLGIDVKAKIIQIEYNYEDSNIKLTIANVKELQTEEEKLVKMLYKGVSTSNTVDMTKFKWDYAENTASEINNIINNTWNAIEREIKAGVNESVEISGRGLLIRDPNDPNRYLIAQHGVLALTDNGGKDWKHAITPDGIVGERIYGKLLAGVNLIIDASDATGTKIFTVDGNGVTIAGTKLTITGGVPTDQLNPDDVARWNSGGEGNIKENALYNGVVIDALNGLVITRSDNKAKAVMNATDGISIQKWNALTSEWDKVLYADTNGNLIAESLTANMLIVKNGNELLIDGKNKIIDFSKFTTITGQLKATNIDATDLKVSSANVTGTLTANQLNLKGMTITNASNATTFSVDTNGNVTISGNITMNGGSISWANVSKPSYNSGEVGAISSTYIDSNGVWTGQINANTITSGTIQGLIIKTNSASNRIQMDSNGFTQYNQNGWKRIQIDSSVAGGQIGFYLDTELRGIIQESAGSFAIYPWTNATMTLGTDGKTTYAQGNWNFSGATVSGLAVTATFG